MNAINAPKISVIIPVYKTNPYTLRQALSSVQSIALPYEVIVVFDGECGPTMQEFVNDRAAYKCEHFLTIEHGGAAAARNAGIRRARGTWVTFLDADDVIIGDGISGLISFAEANDCQLVQGGFTKVMKRRLQRCTLAKESKVYREEGRMEFLCTIFDLDLGTGTPWAKVYNRKFLLKNNLFFDSSMPIEDTPFVFGAVCRSDVVGFVPVIAYEYRRSGESTVTSFSPQYAERMIEYLDRFGRKISLLHAAPIMQAFERHVVSYELLIMVHYIFNSANGWGRAQRKAQYRSISRFPLFANALHRVTLRGFSKAKQISIVALRMHCYGIMRLICAVRNRQLR